MSNDYISWNEVPEEALLSALEDAENMGAVKSANSIKKLFKLAEVYKYAKMTPMFMYNHKTEGFKVFAEETFGKKLH